MGVGKFHSQGLSHVVFGARGHTVYVPSGNPAAWKVPPATVVAIQWFVAAGPSIRQTAPSARASV